jgi:hypothetical protein
MFGYTAVMPVAVPKKKRSLLPLLTVLFVFSYGLMTMLIVEQGKTIQTQRNMIQVLMPESGQFWANKGKEIDARQKALTQKNSQAPSAQAQPQAPSSPAPLAQAPTTRNGKVAKPQAQRPPVPASDLGDDRRMLRSI